MACTNSDHRKATWATAGAVLAALGICGACCLLPIVLTAIGVAGSIIGELDSLARYKWVFVATTAALAVSGIAFEYLEAWLTSP